MMVADKGFSLYVYFPPSNMGTWFISNRRTWKLMSLICRHESFVAKLLAKLRGSRRGFLVAILPAGKGRIWNLCRSPTLALALDLVRRRIGKRGEEEVLQKTVSPQELEEIHLELWACHLCQAHWYTCLNPVFILLLPAAPNRFGQNQAFLP